MELGFALCVSRESFFGRPASLDSGGGGVGVGRQRLGFSVAHTSRKNVLFEKASGVAGDAEFLSKT